MILAVTVVLGLIVLCGNVYIEKLEATIDPDTLLVLTTDGELFQYLDEPR